MNASHGAPAALALILAMPLFAFPALDAPARDTRYLPAHHHAADFAKARALVRPPVLVPEAVLPLGAEYHGQQRTLQETDGLSRNAEDCSRGGCIDNN